MAIHDHTTHTTKESNATHQQHPKIHLQPEEQEYIQAVHARLRKTLAQRARANRLGLNPDEVVNRCIEKLQLRLAYYMGKYSDPVFCANALAKSAFEDYWRDEAIQSGEGARKTRYWERGDANLFDDDPDSGTVFDNEAGSMLAPESFIDTDLFLEFVSALRDAVGERTWNAFMSIYRDGLTQGEAAVAADMSRETLNRKLADMRRVAGEIRNSPKFKGCI